MIRNSKRDVKGAIGDLKTRESKTELRQNIPTDLIAEWVSTRNRDPANYESIIDVED